MARTSILPSRRYGERRARNAEKISEPMTFTCRDPRTGPRVLCEAVDIARMPLWFIKLPTKMNTERLPAEAVERIGHALRDHSNGMSVTKVVMAGPQ